MYWRGGEMRPFAVCDPGQHLTTSQKLHHMVYASFMTSSFVQQNQFRPFLDTLMISRLPYLPLASLSICPIDLVRLSAVEAVHSSRREIIFPQH